LIDPAFENKRFWKDFNPHLETELLYLDDSVSLAGPSFTFEVKSETTCSGALDCEATPELRNL
jgi:hypothetical protein